MRLLRIVLELFYFVGRHAAAGVGYHDGASIFLSLERNGDTAIRGVFYSIVEQIPEDDLEEILVGIQPFRSAAFATHRDPFPAGDIGVDGEEFPDDLFVFEPGPFDGEPVLLAAVPREEILCKLYNGGARGLQIPKQPSGVIACEMIGRIELVEEHVLIIQWRFQIVEDQRDEFLLEGDGLFQLIEGLFEEEILLEKPVVLQPDLFSQPDNED